MTFPLQVYNPNDLIYAYLLASRYRSPWVYDPSNALLSEPDIWEIIRNDTNNLACIQRRNQNIVRPWRVVPSPHAASKNNGKNVEDASKRIASITHEALSVIDRFDAARRTLAEAFFLGRRYAEIQYQEMVISLDGTPPMPWYVPVKVKDADRRRFHWVPEWSNGADGTRRKTGIHIEMFDTDLSSWVTLTPDQRRRYVEYIWEDTEDRIGHGRGAIEALFYAHYFSSGTLKKLIEGIDRWANGFLIGKLDSLRSASTDLSNSQLTTNMKDLLQKIRSEHVAVLEQGDSIELLEPSGTGMNIALELVKYFNEAAERLCNGSVRPSGHSVDGTGSKAASETESDTSEQFYQFPREDLDAVLDRDLLGGFLYFNEANLTALGLDVAKRPKFTSEQVKRQDPKTRLEVLKSLNEVVPVLRSELYEAAEATPVGPDDDAVEPKVMDPFGGGGFSPTGGSRGTGKGGEDGGEDRKREGPPGRE